MNRLPRTLFTRFIALFSNQNPQTAAKIEKISKRLPEATFQPKTTYHQGPGGKEYVRTWVVLTEDKDENGVRTTVRDYGGAGDEQDTVVIARDHPDGCYEYLRGKTHYWNNGKEGGEAKAVMTCEDGTTKTYPASECPQNRNQDVD